jgi:hypothetical protein
MGQFSRRDVARIVRAVKKSERSGATNPGPPDQGLPSARPGGHHPVAVRATSTTPSGSYYPGKYVQYAGSTSATDAADVLLFFTDGSAPADTSTKYNGIVVDQDAATGKPVVQCQPAGAGSGDTCCPKFIWVMTDDFFSRIWLVQFDMTTGAARTIIDPRTAPEWVSQDGWAFCVVGNILYYAWDTGGGVNTPSTTGKVYGYDLGAASWLGVMFSTEWAGTNIDINYLKFDGAYFYLGPRHPGGGVPADFRLWDVYAPDGTLISQVNSPEHVQQNNICGMTVTKSGVLLCQPGSPGPGVDLHDKSGNLIKSNFIGTSPRGTFDAVNGQSIFPVSLDTDGTNIYRGFFENGNVVDSWIEQYDASGRYVKDLPLVIPSSVRHLGTGKVRFEDDISVPFAAGAGGGGAPGPNDAQAVLAQQVFGF